MNLESLLRAGCACAALAASLPAYAQAGPPAAPEPAQAKEQTAASTSEQSKQQASGSGVVQDIVITAQRRAESLQKVAISGTALNSEALTEKAVTRLSDVQFAAPSVSITDNGGLVQSTNIRGIGLASGSPSVANGVATYFDGLFQPPIVQTGTFYDIANVEVLRGPQGTLVGSNSTGGAIFITSQNPRFGRVGGYVEGGYGNYDAVSLQGAVNLPVSGNLAIRAAGNFRRRDSYYHDAGPLDNHPGRLNEKAGRIGLLWKPGNFQLLLKSELLQYDTGGFAFQPLGTLASGGDIRELHYNSPTKAHQKAYINSAELKYFFDNGITLRTIGGFQDKHVNLLIDNDATDTASVFTDQYVRERQLTGEVNLISPAEWRFNWIFGVYYQRNRIDVSLAQDNPFLFPFDLGLPEYLDVGQKQYKWTTGIFAQLNYKLTDRLEVQLGGRYSHFKSRGAGAVSIGRGLPIFPPEGLQVADLAGSHKDGRPTGKLALNYQLNRNNLLYAFAARGYKPGGYNSATSQFRPETVWDYELGWKSTLAGGHLRTQLDAFYNKYKDFQFEIIDTTTGQNGVTNLPTATIKGVEAQLQAKFGGFSADGAVSYIDSKLPAFQAVNPRLLPPGNLGPQCPVGTPPGPTCFDYGPFIQTAGGGPNLLSPKRTFNAGAQYEIPLGGGSSITPRLNYGYVGKQYAGLFYSPTLDTLRSRGLLSALLTYRNGDWEVEAWGTNLANKKYVSGINGTTEFYGAPREYGLRANLKF